MEVVRRCKKVAKVQIVLSINMCSAKDSVNIQGERSFSASMGTGQTLGTWLNRPAEPISVSSLEVPSLICEN